MFPSKTAQSPGPVGVGGFGGSYFFDGLIDEPFVFDDELSAAEVSDIYTDGISGDNGGSD